MTTILVPEINIWTPEIDWPEWMKRKKARIDKFVAAAVYSSGVQDHFTTVTPARSTLFSWTYSTGSGTDAYNVVGDGYDGGNDYYTSSNVGSIGDGTFVDGGSNARTVAAVYYAPDIGAPAGPSPAADDLFFSMTQTSVPDTDTSFVDIQIEDNAGTLRTFTRASRNNYYASTGSVTTWRWRSVTNSPYFVVATGIRDFNIRF